MSDARAAGAELERAGELAHAGKLAEARDLITALADRCADEDAAMRAALLARASELALYAAGPAAAEPLVERAIADAERSADPGARLHAYSARARVCLRVHTDRAVADAEAALEDALLPGAELPGALRAVALELRGMACARRGSVRAALEHFATAYALAEGHVEQRARVLLTWAVQLRNWGLFEEAERRARRSLEVRLELGDDYGAAMCYGVLAFIYQRQGRFEDERDALAADLRACERMGGTADVPGLRARLAGALVGMGKYAGAWDEAGAAIAAEPGGAGADERTGTRVHGYAWREQARVSLARSRFDEGLALAARATAVFERVSDGYGAALCRLTEAELSSASGEPSRARAALAAARPVFVRLGAVPEAVETVLIEAALDGDHAAARRIVQQVLPMLQQAGLGATQLYARAADQVQALDPALAVDRVVTQAAMLRSVAAVIVETDPQPATVIGARVEHETAARDFGRAAVDGGAVVIWPASSIALAVFLGAGHAERAAAFTGAIDAAIEAACVSETGAVDLEHMWPAGVRARGTAIDAALARVLGDSP